MSESAAATFAAIETIQAAQITLARISTPILVVLGNIGEFLSILVFIQPAFRTNSCAIYFLAASCTRIFFINCIILVNGLIFGYQIDPTQNSLILCKMKFYVSYVFGILPPSFVVLACLDRLKLSSSNANTRLWSRPRIAYRSIAVVSIFWILVSIHSLFGSTVLYGPGYSYCYIEPSSYALFVAFYAVIVNTLLPPALMITFGLLTIVNIQRIRRRTRPLDRPRQMQRKDQHLLRMLLFQVLANIIFTIPSTVYFMYTVISANWQKDLVRQYLELFIYVLALTLFGIPNCLGFYIYTLTGGIFRNEFKRLVIQCYHRLTCHQAQQVFNIQINAAQRRTPRV